MSEWQGLTYEPINNHNKRWSLSPALAQLVIATTHHLTFVNRPWRSVSAMFDNHQPELVEDQHHDHVINLHPACQHDI